MTDRANSTNLPTFDFFQGAMLYSAVGDALGWPTEYGYTHKNRGLKPFYEVPLAGFVEWRQLYAGWSGYEEPVRAGEYSDDTQLTLAIARCISVTGQIDAERFAYEELPLWLQYQRGGGQTLKVAARLLLDRELVWNNNFYDTGGRLYTQAGANGAAMRNLPVALANVGDEHGIVKNSFVNAIVTHGHPRAILGTVLYGLAVNYALIHAGGSVTDTLIEYLSSNIQSIESMIEGDLSLAEWVRQWDKHSKEPFWSTFKRTRLEATRFLEGISRFPTHLDYYKFIGARNPLYKGSGLATVCAAIYLFLHFHDQPEMALATSANTFGSDTDTIAAFLGALLGAYHGRSAASMPQVLLNSVQDHDYLLYLPEHLHSIAAHRQREQGVEEQKLSRRDDIYRRIENWEMNYFLNMFRSTGVTDDKVIHPILGDGTIIERVERAIPEKDFDVKLVRVQFTCGQSCLFRSKVEKDGRISESLLSGSDGVH